MGVLLVIQRIQDYETLRDEYLNMAPPEEREIWNDVANSFFLSKPHLTERQQEAYTRWSINNFLCDHFGSNASDKSEMEEWLNDLEFYRQEYYGCKSVLDFINT